MPNLGMNTATRITCRYSCDTCAVSRVVLSVPTRTNDDWNAWMASTMVLLQEDHLRRSNLGATCPGTLTELIFGVNPNAVNG